ncbi:MAG TPA: hypothetical protein VMA77_31060 [Solirubrobacteraceae bacterium]|nr:hypothetical protein [Solirubrobacteraceae bacterium]
MVDTDDRQIGSTPSGATAGAVNRAGVDGPQTTRILSELESLLTEPGCPICRHVADAERRFFSWFEIESYTVAEVQAQLRAATGMCPGHARRLVEELGEGHIMTVVMREALAGARSAVKDNTRIGTCPACASVASASKRARSLVLDGVQNPSVARQYAKHEGICLVHLLDAVPVAGQATLKTLTERLLASLHQAAGAPLVGLLAGLDADAPRRAMWRERLPSMPTGGSTLERLADRMKVDACPVCLATGVGARDYLRWFVAHATEGDPSLKTDPGELCATHLHDVALAEPSAASSQAAEHKRAARIGQLELFLGSLADLPAPARRGRRNNGDPLDEPRRNLLAAPHCAACHAREGVERAQRELIAASLALQPVRAPYEQSHGLCVRHARALQDGPTAGFARHHTDARLAVLAWEVQETARKYAWAFRHESTGPERDGWLRGLTQIDGRVFEGGPAPIGGQEVIPRDDEAIGSDWNG